MRRAEHQPTTTPRPPDEYAIDNKGRSDIRGGLFVARIHAKVLPGRGRGHRHQVDEVQAAPAGKWRTNRQGDRCPVQRMRSASMLPCLAVAEALSSLRGKYRRTAADRMQIDAAQAMPGTRRCRPTNPYFQAKRPAV